MPSLYNPPKRLLIAILNQFIVAEVQHTIVDNCRYIYAIMYGCGGVVVFYQSRALSTAL